MKIVPHTAHCRRDVSRLSSRSRDDIEMQHHRSRHSHTRQNLVEAFGLLAVPRKAVENHPPRGKLAPEPALAPPRTPLRRPPANPKPECPAVSNPPAYPLGLRAQHIACRKARNSQLPRQPGTLRPFAAPRRAEKYNDPSVPRIPIGHVATLRRIVNPPFQYIRNRLTTQSCIGTKSDWSVSDYFLVLYNPHGN